MLKKKKKIDLHICSVTQLSNNKSLMNPINLCARRARGSFVWRVCMCECVRVHAQTNDYNHAKELNKAPTGIVWEVNNGV